MANLALVLMLKWQVNVINGKSVKLYGKSLSSMQAQTWNRFTTCTTTDTSHAVRQMKTADSRGIVEFTFLCKTPLL